MVDITKIKLNVRESNRSGKGWELPIIEESTRSNLRIEKFSRRSFTPDVVNQGSIGSCVGQAGRIVVSDTSEYRRIKLSSMWIYKTAKKYDQWAGEDYEGTSVSGACEGLRKEGVCLEEYWPYVSREDTSHKPEAPTDAAKRKIKSYYRVGYDRPEEIMELLKRESLWCSVKVHTDFYRVFSDGIIDEDVYLASKYAGGHSMAIIGWKFIDGKLHWELQNSFGTNWGNKGYCFIPHSLMKKIKTSDAYYIVTRSDEHKYFETKRDKERNKKDIGYYMNKVFGPVHKMFRTLMDWIT